MAALKTAEEKEAEEQRLIEERKRRYEELTAKMRASQAAAAAQREPSPAAAADVDNDDAIASAQPTAAAGAGAAPTAPRSRVQSETADSGAVGAGGSGYGAGEGMGGSGDGADEEAEDADADADADADLLRPKSPSRISGVAAASVTETDDAPYAARAPLPGQAPGHDARAGARNPLAPAASDHGASGRAEGVQGAPAVAARATAAAATGSAAAAAAAAADPAPAVKPSIDIFSEDMFSDAPVAAPAAAPAQGIVLADDNATLTDNWDDPDGYYLCIMNELIHNGRYKVQGTHGRGVFSSVLLCHDLHRGGEAVAIKVIRANDTMRRAGEKELALCNEVAEADPENKRHCVRLLAQFEHRNHLCLVFERMQDNLRTVLKRFGRGVGITVSAVRAFGRQLFVALRHLHNLGIVHADLKPDNILVNERHNVLKVCDFGSAFRISDHDNDPTPYLVSRFYRGPEIILGMRYSMPVDVWSLGCCLFELFTGQLLFPGESNNAMLRLFQEVKGPFSHKMLRRHQRAYELLLKEPHFTDDFQFRAREADPVTGAPTLRLHVFTAPTRDLSAMLLAAKSKSDDRRSVLQLADLLEKCFVLDPEKRITASAALRHPFFQRAVPKAGAGKAAAGGKARAAAAAAAATTAAAAAAPAQ